LPFDALACDTIKESVLSGLLTPLTLRPGAAIDLHMHTTYSDGRWPAQQLIDYLVDEGFALVAVTDHDRVDRVGDTQNLAAQKGLPVLSGVEMSTEWRGKMGDILCYGFDPSHNYLSELTERIVRKQQENAQAVYAHFVHKGYQFPKQDEVLAGSEGVIRSGGDVIRLLRAHGYASDWFAGLRMIYEAGYQSTRVDMAETVDAAHRSGAVCLIAHPGRREQGFTFYAPDLLDQVRADMPMDGIEVYHPSHSAEITETYQAYARKHNLLISAGSDSHSIPGRMPIKHPAEMSRTLLERLGISVR
jgi:predicted metal-dependent phosphoesterase TrpH